MKIIIWCVCSIRMWEYEICWIVFIWVIFFFAYLTLFKCWNDERFWAQFIWYINSWHNTNYGEIFRLVGGPAGAESPGLSGGTTFNTLSLTFLSISFHFLFPVLTTTLLQSLSSSKDNQDFRVETDTNIKTNLEISVQISPFRKNQFVRQRDKYIDVLFAISSIISFIDRLLK